MSKHITTRQIRELSKMHRNRTGGLLAEVAAFAALQGVDEQADELRDVMGLLIDTDKAGSGLGEEFQSLLDRLTSGGLKLSDDERVRQTKILWDLRFGEVLGAKSFKKYLNGTDALEPIPEVPVWPSIYPDYLDRNVLTDKRVLEKVGLVEVCRLLGVTYPGSDSTFVSYESGHSKSGLYWMRAQAGHRNRDHSPRTCRQSRFATCEVGGEAFEGLSIFAQDRNVEHYMDLPGSVHADSRDDVAYLHLWYDRPELYWGWDDSDVPDYGSASRRE